VREYVEEDANPSTVADGFLAFVESHLQLMEMNHARAHEDGGYYLSVGKHGTQMSFPPAGQRALD
jgi:hypothetical protein